MWRLGFGGESTIPSSVGVSLASFQGPWSNLQPLRNSATGAEYQKGAVDDPSAAQLGTAIVWPMVHDCS